MMQSYRNSTHSLTSPTKALAVLAAGKKSNTSSPDANADLDVYKKGRLVQKWEIVLNKKESNTECRQKQLNDMLMKRFKREKDSTKREKERMAEQMYYQDKNNEKMEQAKRRK